MSNREITAIKIGQTYNYFDDGKIKLSRKYDVKITNIILFNEIDPTTLKLWKEEVNGCDWIYNKFTDYFILGDLMTSIDKEKIIFVRTLENEWFSLGVWGGYLDYDGRLLNQMETNRTIHE